MSSSKDTHTTSVKYSKDSTQEQIVKACPSSEMFSGDCSHSPSASSAMAYDKNGTSASALNVQQDGEFVRENSSISSHQSVTQPNINCPSLSSDEEVSASESAKGADLESSNGSSLGNECFMDSSKMTSDQSQIHHLSDDQMPKKIDIPTYDQIPNHTKLESIHVDDDYTEETPTVGSHLRTASSKQAEKDGKLKAKTETLNQVSTYGKNTFQDKLAQVKSLRPRQSTSPIALTNNPKRRIKESLLSSGDNQVCPEDDPGYGQEKPSSPSKEGPAFSEKIYEYGEKVISPFLKKSESKNAAKDKSLAPLKSNSLFSKKAQRRQIRESLLDHDESTGGSAEEAYMEGGDTKEDQIVEDKNLEKLLDAKKQRSSQSIKVKKEDQKNEEEVHVVGCFCEICKKKRHQTAMLINVEKDDTSEEEALGSDDEFNEFEELDHAKFDFSPVKRGTTSSFNRPKPKGKEKEWGRIMLAEDEYQSSDSDEVAKVKSIMKKKTSANLLRQSSGFVGKLDETQEKIQEKIQAKKLKKNTDKEIMTRKRAQVMELFMELDKNNDNFVERADLLKHYGLLHRIKEATVVPQYKCKYGHPMKIVVHDKNFKANDQVKIGFKQTNENKSDLLFKYNQSFGEYRAKHGESEHIIECDNDHQKQYFKSVNIIKKDCPLLAGEPVVCCQDKECKLGPTDNKQTWIFCPHPDCSKDTYNFTICQLHASEYEDSVGNEQKVQEQDIIKAAELKKSIQENLQSMILFLSLQVQDDNFVDKEEWMQLLGNIVQNSRPSEQAGSQLDIPKDQKGMDKLFEGALDNDQNFDELGFRQFNKLVQQLNMNPQKTYQKTLRAQLPGLKRLLICFRDNPCTRYNNKERALKKLAYDCDMSEDIVNEFEGFFKKSGETKMDIYDFYRIIEKSEVDVEKSCMVLNNLHYKRKIHEILCLTFCRKQRRSQSVQHVDTFDQIEAEKHQYDSKSKLSEQDSLSKLILVYLSVIQFIDLITDGKLLFDMYSYSRIRYVDCSESRIDYMGAAPSYTERRSKETYSFDFNHGCSIYTDRDLYLRDRTSIKSDPARLFAFDQLYTDYTDDNERSYKIATTTMLMSMFSTYLVAHSSIIKLFLDNGSYEPQIIKLNSILTKIFKIVFLTFLGPFYIMGIEMVSTIMAICQMVALLVIGYEGFDIIRRRFMHVFENVLGLNEERTEGLKNQRTIAQLFFENGPMVVIQILIQIEYLKCSQLQNGSTTVLYVSFATTAFSMLACFITIKLESTALDENALIFCLNCLQARQGWIPFLHQISTNNLRRTCYDYGRIVCSYPLISARSLYFKFFKFQFTDVSLSALISEIATMGMKLERLNETREKIKIFIGRSTNLVTIETVLHVYQLVMQQPDIEINLDGINWAVILENSKKSFHIPRTNDINQVFTDKIKHTAIQNKVRKETSTKFQKIEIYDSKTQAGDFSLWICADDENSQNLKEFAFEKDPLYQEFARSKRLVIDRSPVYENHKNHVLEEIEGLEKKRNHYFNIEAQIEQDSKDGIFLKNCILLQRRFRGYRSRKHFSMKNLRTAKANLLRRNIIDLLKDKTDYEQVKLIRTRLEKQKKVSDALEDKLQELTSSRDKDKDDLANLKEMHKKAQDTYNEIEKEQEKKNAKFKSEEKDYQEAIEIAKQQISQQNKDQFDEFFFGEMQVPTKKCVEVIRHLYYMLTSKRKLENVNFTWKKALRMMNSQKLIDECQRFNTSKIEDVRDSSDEEEEKKDDEEEKKEEQDDVEEEEEEAPLNHLGQPYISRGPCLVCGKTVWTSQARLRTEMGNYVHQDFGCEEEFNEKCVENPQWEMVRLDERAKKKEQKKLQKQKEATQKSGFERLMQWKIDVIQPKQDVYFSELMTSPVDDQFAYPYSKTLSMICTWIVKMIDASKAFELYKKEEEAVAAIKKKMQEQQQKIDELKTRIDKNQESIKTQEATISKDEKEMNYEKDETTFLKQVLDQLTNQKIDKDKKINLDSYELFDHYEVACKNEKLQKSLMCSVGNCAKFFAGEVQLKRHYKTCHPGAMFEIDYPNPDSKLVSASILKEQERVGKFMNEKKEWIKEDVEYARKKFVKKNTLFKVISDNFKENEDYYELHQKFRIFERRCKDIDFFSKSQDLKMKQVIEEKSNIKSSGAQELSQAQKAVKTAYRSLKAIKEEELKKVIELIQDKDIILERKDINFDVEVDEKVTFFTNKPDYKGKKKSKDSLTDPSIDDYWMTGFEPNVTYVKFKFEQPMLINQFTIIYEALSDGHPYISKGASDPQEWILKVKNANFPYNVYEITQKSKYSGNIYDIRPKQGEKEQFKLEDQLLTEEITLVFTKIRDFDHHTYCRDVAVRGFKFLGQKPKFIHQPDELKGCLKAFDEHKSTDFKLLQELKEPSTQVVKACKIMCLALNKFPDKTEMKELQRYKGDPKCFFSKTLVNSFKNYNKFIEDLTSCDVSKLDTKSEKLIKSIIGSEIFSEESLQDQNKVVQGIKSWAQAYLNYLAGVKKSKVLFTADEIGMLKKVIKSYLAMIQKLDTNSENLEQDSILVEQLTQEKLQNIVKNFDFRMVSKKTLRIATRLSHKYEPDTVQKISPPLYHFSQWVKSIIEFFKAKKQFDHITKVNLYADYQIITKEKEIKRLKLKKDEILNKIETLKEDETVLQKNLIVKNKNWVLEGCMKVLLEDGCDPNITDNQGETLLIHAIKNNKLKAIELLLENDCKITTRNAQGMSAFGQAVTSMNSDALLLLLKYEAGKSMVHEPQIYDKQISHKILTPVHYLCKLIRLKGLTPEFQKMITTVQNNNVTCKVQAEKEGVFRQFGRLFSTMTDDMNPNKLMEIMKIYQSFVTNDYLLTMRDRKKNNFLHLISKNFIYEHGDKGHSNYKFLFQKKIGNQGGDEKLSQFCDGNWIAKLKMLSCEKNFEGITPIRMAFENNQFSLIQILIENDIIQTFFQEDEEHMMQYLMRFAQIAYDVKEFDVKVKLLRNHIQNKYIGNAKFNNYRLPFEIRFRGRAMLKKLPSLEKQFTKLLIIKSAAGDKAANDDKGKAPGTPKRRGSNAQLNLGEDENKDKQEGDQSQELSESDDEEKSKNEDVMDIDSDGEDQNMKGDFSSMKYTKVESLNEFVRIKTAEPSLEILKSQDLKDQLNSFQVVLYKDHVSYDFLPPEQKLNEYIEFLFNLLLETIALFDLGGDIILMYALFLSEHTAWFSLSLLSCLSPFFVCYVPLLTFQKKKLNDKQSLKPKDKQLEIDFLTALSMITFLTPGVLIYLQCMDIIYIINSVGLVPLAILIQLASFGMLKGNMAHYLENKLDSIYEIAFGMQQMDIKGFRRLRTISQLSFESMPQILIQSRILYYNMFHPGSAQALNVDHNLIIGSLACAFLHAFIEAIFVSLESQACRTTFTHYCIVCFNARFNWIPFQNLFAAGASEDESNKIDYENIRNSLAGQQFDVDFAFSKSTAQVLIKCISQLPIESNELKRKNLYIGSSMNDVDMDKLIDLIEMANRRVNLFIDGINVHRILKRDDSKHILANVHSPKLKDGKHDSIFLKLIQLGRSHVVKEMFKVNPKTDLIPQPFQVAVNNKDYQTCKTLINENDENVNASISEIKDNKCQFEQILKLGEPSITASLFSNKEWLICESYQYLVFQQILDYIRERDLGKSFDLLKVLCGPNIPVHLIRGIGLSRTQQSNRPAIVESRKKYQDEYRQHRSILLKFQRAFPESIYIITKAPQYEISKEDGEKKCVKQYIPFQKLKDLSQDQQKDRTYKNFVGKQLKQKLRLSSEEAYSFSLIRQMLLDEPLELERNQDDQTMPDDRIGQVNNPLDLSELNLDPLHIKIVAMLVSFDNHSSVPSLTKQDIKKCDEVVKVLMLDRQRSAYFARSRLLDQTEQMNSHQAQKFEEDRYYFDAHWRKVVNLNQRVFNKLVLHPYLENYRVANADLRWVQVLHEFIIPDDAVAIKSFEIQFESYRAIISLNILKPQYQTSYIISNETDTEVNDGYTERFYEKEVSQDELPVPDGFQDVISSMEKGDKLMILMSRTKNTLHEKDSSYVKNLKIDISFIKDHGYEFSSNKVNENAKYMPPALLDTIVSKDSDEIVILEDTNIKELKEVEKNRKIFQLLDYFEHSRLNKAQDLDYFESFFFFGNTSDLSKILTANIWQEYKNLSCKGGFSFNQCIYPGIEMRDSKYGVQAYSEHSYSKFSQLFDLIIYQIHQTNSHQTRLKVKNIKEKEIIIDEQEMTIDDITRVFKKQGQVECCYDKSESGEFLGTATVTYEKPSDAAKAIIEYKAVFRAKIPTVEFETIHAILKKEAEEKKIEEEKRKEEEEKKKAEQSKSQDQKKSQEPEKSEEEKAKELAEQEEAKKQEAIKQEALKLEAKKQEEEQRKREIQRQKDYDEQQARLIHKIKSSIKRNIKDFPLCPGLSEKQRNQVMIKIKAACLNLKNLDKKLEGKFIELKNLKLDALQEEQSSANAKSSELSQEQNFSIQNKDKPEELSSDSKNSALLKEHIFSIQDKFQKTCGFENDWPNDRAIFFNEDLSLVIKINQIDHLLIEYSQQKISVKQFFEENFLKIVQVLDDQLRFSYDERLGYITSQPEDLGTSMKTQIILNAPNILIDSNSKRSEDDILGLRTQLAENISNFKDHSLNIKGDGSEIGNSLELDQISITSMEKMGTQIDDAVKNLRTSTNRIIDSENMVVNNLNINHKNRVMEFNKFEHLFVSGFQDDIQNQEKRLACPFNHPFIRMTEFPVDEWNVIFCYSCKKKIGTKKSKVCEIYYDCPICLMHICEKDCSSKYKKYRRPEKLQTYLSKQIWDKFKDQKTKDGANFIDCVYPGMKETSSKIILCAGSKDCYEEFSELFDHYIKDYHGHDPNEKVVKSQMDFFDMRDTVLPIKNTFQIESVQFTIKRNFEGFKLGPSGLSKQERETIFNDLQEVSQQFKLFDTHDIKISGNMQDNQKLVSIQETEQSGTLSIFDGFDEEDILFLETALMDQHWPNGRAIYKSSDKAFKMKINYIDQLEIDLKQRLKFKEKKGDERREIEQFCDIFKVYQKLCILLYSIESKRKFLYSDKLGYLTSLPKDLGAFDLVVCLRTPILHAIIENLGGKIQDFIHYDVLQKYSIDYDGFYVQDDENDDFQDVEIIKLRSKQSVEEDSFYRFNRFYKNEKMMVQDMMSCVKELTDLENQYQDQYQLLRKYEKIKSHEDIKFFDSFFIKFNLGDEFRKTRKPFIQHDCTLKKVLTEEIWEDYKDESCDMNFKFTQSIYPDIMRKKTQGLYAGSNSSYQKFDKLFLKYIEEDNQLKPDELKKQSSDFKKQHLTSNVQIPLKKNLLDLKVISTENSFLVSKEVDDRLKPFNIGDSDKDHEVKAWPLKKGLPSAFKEHQAIIQKTELKVRRNLQKYPFVGNMKLEDRVRLLLEVTQATEKYTGELKGQFYRYLNLNSRETEDLKDLLVPEKEDEEKKDTEQENVQGKIQKDSPSKKKVQQQQEEDVEPNKRDWPYGRGIFLNKERNFNITVGIHDHLQITSLQSKTDKKTCDVMQTFKMLMKGVAHLDKHLEFAFDDKIGYTTQWTNHLGALEAIVEIQPKYFKYYKEQVTPEIIAKKFKVDLQIQEKKEGEEEESQNIDLLTLKNMNKLGKTESEILVDILKCLREFFRLEDQFSQKYRQKLECEKKIPLYIQKTHEHDQNNKDQDKEEKTDFSRLENELKDYHDRLLLDELYKSRLPFILTPEIWQEYSNQSCKFGFPFKDSFIEVMHQHDQLLSHQKIVAGSSDAYNKFKKFFVNCLKEFGHQKAEEFEKEPKQKVGVKDQVEFQNRNFEIEDLQLIKQLKIGVRRNITGYPLAAALSNKQRIKLRDKIIEACKKVFTGKMTVVKLDSKIEKPKTRWNISQPEVVHKFMGGGRARVIRMGSFNDFEGGESDEIFEGGTGNDQNSINSFDDNGSDAVGLGSAFDELFGSDDDEDIEEFANRGEQYRMFNLVEKAKSDFGKPENGKMVSKDMFTGRARIHDEDELFCVDIHDIDHIQFSMTRRYVSYLFKNKKNQVIQLGDMVDEFKETLKKLDDELNFDKVSTLGYITARPYDLGMTIIEMEIDLKNLSNNSQNLNDHTQGEFYVKANPLPEKVNKYQVPTYTLSNVGKCRGVDENDQIQNFFDYMQELFAAYRRYNQFTLISNVENILGKEFETLFPPSAEIQPVIYKRKILTKELWEKYGKGNAVCKFGKNFASCIFPGFIDKRNEMAICAQSSHSYEAFDTLFDEFIKQGPQQKEFVSGVYQNTQFTQKNEKMITKVSIVLLRNIKGFPLVPGITKDERLKVMDIVEKCCEEFQNEWQGTFYKLESISDSERKIIQDIAPSSADERNFYKLSNEGKDWPSGRALYVNQQHNLQIHVNRSDHMAIHYSEDNISIQDFLDKVMEILRIIQLRCEFQFTEKNGYLTSFPYQLRFVDFRVQLDDTDKKISQNITKSFLRQFDCIGSQDVPGEFDIRNQNCNDGYPAESEQKQIQNVINALQKTFTKMQQKEDEQKVYNEQRSEANKLKIFEIFMRGNDHYGQLLTEQIWNKYSSMKCQLDVPFKSIVYPGIVSPKDKFWLCASSLSCYQFYNELFEKHTKLVLKKEWKKDDYHVETSSLVSYLQNTEFNENENEKILKQAFLVRRNFAGLPMGPGQTKESRKLVLEIVEKLCQSLDGKLYKYESISEDEKKELKALDNVNINNIKSIDTGGVYQLQALQEKQESKFLELGKVTDDWPNSRAVFVNRQKNIFIWVNTEDHLTIFMNEEARGLMGALNKFILLMNHLESLKVVMKIEEFPVVLRADLDEPLQPGQKIDVCKFAFDPKLGYVTTLPYRCSPFGLFCWMKTHRDMQNDNDDDEYNQITTKHSMSSFIGSQNMNTQTKSKADKGIRNSLIDLALARNKADLKKAGLINDQDQVKLEADFSIEAARIINKEKTYEEAIKEQNLRNILTNENFYHLPEHIQMQNFINALHEIFKNFYKVPVELVNSEYGPSTQNNDEYPACNALMDKVLRKMCGKGHSLSKSKCLNVSDTYICEVCKEERSKIVTSLICHQCHRQYCPKCFEIEAYTQTAKGSGMFWQAQFKKPSSVSRVKILSTSENGDRLSDTEVFIGKQKIGKLPTVTKNGKWYSVKPEIPIQNGECVRLVNENNSHFQIQSIIVFSNEIEPIVEGSSDFQGIKQLTMNVTLPENKKVLQKTDQEIKAESQKKDDLQKDSNQDRIEDGPKEPESEISGEAAKGKMEFAASSEQDSSKMPSIEVKRSSITDKRASQKETKNENTQEDDEEAKKRLGELKETSEEITKKLQQASKFINKAIELREQYDASVKQFEKSAMSFGKDIQVWQDETKFQDVWVQEEDGSKYKGFWRDGMKHGRGIQVKTNEEYFDGEFNFNLRTGFGISIKENGERYEGTWFNNKFQDFGILTKDGKQQEGIWEQGELQDPEKFD